MKKFLYRIFVLILIFSTITLSALAHLKPDDISFNDYSGVISDGVKNYVKSNNVQLFSKTKAKIIFVTTDTTNGATTLSYAKKLFTSWDIGNIGRNNSVFVVMCPDSKDYAVIQGKNINRILNDTVLYEIISKDFEPHFAKGDYDTAVLSLYNSLGKWYLDHYSDLSLNLDDDFKKYIAGEKTAELEKKPSKLWIWVTVSVAFVMLVVFLKIKNNVEFKIRQRERVQNRKTRKADIDKIINS